jgi:hypothetical protein
VLISTSSCQSDGSLTIRIHVARSRHIIGVELSRTLRSILAIGISGKSSVGEAYTSGDGWGAVAPNKEESDRWSRSTGPMNDGSGGESLG